MSEIHIRDLRVRPESLCGYTGPPGKGDPTCASCIAVDEELVEMPSRWERFCDRVLMPLVVVAVLVMAYGIFFCPLAVAIVASAVAGSLMVIAVPLGFVIESLRPAYLQGTEIEEVSSRG
jgi:hypothetical protein